MNSHPMPQRRRITRERRGVALILTLIVTAAIAALAMAAILLSGNATLIGRQAERERDMRYAAEAALQMGKSRLNNDPDALPDTGYQTMTSNGTLRMADGTQIPNLNYNLYVGPTGSTTGQFGRFASVVSEVTGPRNAKFVRRLELQQESFARYAYWTDQETTESGGTIVFTNGDVLWGPVWSNDVITINSNGATFNDEVGTAKTISGASNGTFKKGYKENQDRIELPDTKRLAKLPGYAAAGNLSFNAPTSGNETVTRMRIEFVAVDLNGDGDSTDADEGFFRIYSANGGQQTWLRGDYDGDKSDAYNCGDWHSVVVGLTTQWKFFPAAVHSQAWAKLLWTHALSGGMSAAQANAHGDADMSTIFAAPLVTGQPQPRCYLGGDPHLAAIDGDYATQVLARIGGDDATFVPNGKYGSWAKWPGAVDARLAAIRPWDAAYLFPLHRSLNSGAKGVIYVDGTVGVSGTLRGRVTLYSNRSIVLLDDLRYATDPASGKCNDILGMVAGEDIVVADNGVNSPQNPGAGYRTLDDTKDEYIMGVMMALKTSFRVENYSSGPTDVNDCGTVDWGRGCLFLTGGIIQERRGAVGTTGGTGFLKRYSYDRCAVTIPPPYFPTTGRFIDNRLTEMDPARFNVGELFKALTPTM
jgi:hypothetical protein